MAKSNRNAVAQVEQISEEQIEQTVEQVEQIETVEQIGNAEQLIKEHKTKSGAIRFLASKGWKVAAIANHMNIRYQHARNVLNQPMKKTV